jgi:hypothetical protein
MPKLIINKSIIPAIESGKSFCYLGRYFNYEMKNNEHKSELVSLLTDLMKEIDLKPLHPKNNILLYSRYALSKLSWHFTIAPTQKTWISENLDSVFKQHTRKWLEVPISGSLSNIYLTSNKFGLVSNSIVFFMVWTKTIPSPPLYNTMGCGPAAPCGH